MYVKVSAIPPNREYIIIRSTDGITKQFPRKYARHLKVGDVCLLTEYCGRPQLKLLTDDDEVVIVGTSTRWKPEPKQPEPIQTPEAKS